MSQLMRCAMCGHRFDPKEHSSCESCPLSSGCQLTCCPACGYETVDVERSSLARLFARLLFKEKDEQQAYEMSLVDVPPGCWAKIVNYSSLISIEKQAHLQAYGLVDGHAVRVIQHSPVTVVQVDHTELALEKSLASAVQVEELLEKL